MKGEDADRGATPRPAGEDGDAHSAAGPERHDPIRDLIAKLASASDSGTALSLGSRATVTVRKVAADAYRVDGERRR